MLSSEPFFSIVCKKVEYPWTWAARSVNARAAIWRVEPTNSFTAISPRFVNNGPAKTYASSTAQCAFGGHANTSAMALRSPRAVGHAANNGPDVMCS